MNEHFEVKKVSYETKNSRMDLVIFVEYSIQEIWSDIVCQNRPDHFKFLKGCIPEHAY